MKIDRVRSCCSKTAEENAIKLSASPNGRIIFTSSEYHVTQTRFENAAVFFQKVSVVRNYIETSGLFWKQVHIFARVCQKCLNYCTFYKTDPFSPHCAIMRFFH